MTSRDKIQIRCSPGVSVVLRHRFGTPQNEALGDIDLVGWRSSETMFGVLNRNSVRENTHLEWRDAGTGAVRIDYELDPRPQRRVAATGGPLALISATRPPRLELWDLGVAERVGEFDLGALELADLSVSADARFAAIQSEDDVTLVAIADRRICATVPGRSPIAVSDDGELFVAHASSGLALDVRSRGGSRIASLEPPEGLAIGAAAFTRDSRAVVAGLSDGSLLCWEIAAGSTRWHRSAHDRHVVEIARTLDGATFFSLSDRREVRASTSDGDARWVWSPSWPVHATRDRRSRLAASASGALLAVGDRGWLRVLDAATGAERARTGDRDGPVACLAVSRSGAYVAVGTPVGVVFVLDVARGDLLWTLEFDGAAPTTVEFLPDRPALRTCDSRMAMRLWNLETGFEERRWSIGGDAPVAAWGALDGSRVLVQRGRCLELWSDLAAEPVQWSIALPEPGAVVGVAFDGAAVLTCAPGAGLKGWDVSSLDAEAGWTLGTRFLREPPLALQETLAGPVSLTRSASPTALLCLLTEEWGQRRTRTIQSHFSVARISADGRWLVGSYGHRIEVWSIEANPERAAQIDLGSDMFVSSLALSEDGTTVAVGTRESGVLIFSLAATG